MTEPICAALSEHQLSVKKQPVLRAQKTVAQSVSYSGIGIHTGQEVTLSFVPAKAGEGIFFKRLDLPGQPIIPATFEYVFDTSRSTNICVQDARVYTVEHVLAALRAYEIDNVCIELTNIEPPAGNGSSDVFVELLEQAGTQVLDSSHRVESITHPVYYSEKNVQLIALPSDEYRISYTLHYPNVEALGTQFHSVVVNCENFRKELAPCRTFALYNELSYLIDKGLIRGGSLDNAVVVKDDAVISKNGLYFKNEMVRHKILDVIGDLSLVGIHFQAHIIAICSGHSSNVAFAKKLFNHILMEKNV